MLLLAHIYITCKVSHETFKVNLLKELRNESNLDGIFSQLANRVFSTNSYVFNFGLDTAQGEQKNFLITINTFFLFFALVEILSNFLAKMLSAILSMYHPLWP